MLLLSIRHYACVVHIIAFTDVLRISTESGLTFSLFVTLHHCCIVSCSYDLPIYVCFQMWIILIAIILVIIIIIVGKSSFKFGLKTSTKKCPTISSSAKGFVHETSSVQSFMVNSMMYASFRLVEISKGL